MNDIADRQFIDIGSTIIKCITVKGDAEMENAFISRRRDVKISDQVLELLANGGIPAAKQRKIISSANGGLSVGLVCLSRRYSGWTAQSSLEVVGANVRFLHTWGERLTESQDRESAADIPKVDHLVVVGGVDTMSAEPILERLPELSLDSYRYDDLIYAGHCDGAQIAGEKWPMAAIVANPLGESLKSSNHALSTIVRERYLDDIESKAEILPLRPSSETPIEPTPGVVSRAFRRLQERLPSPSLLFDVGGATTDVHFAKELLDEKSTTPLGAFPIVGRHVFTAYGVKESRETTIRALLADRRCINLLRQLDGEGYRHTYMKLEESQADERLLATACVFLALRGVTEIAAEGVPRLELTRAVTFGITGGGSQLIGPRELEIAVRAATAMDHIPVVAVDKRYRWWILGLTENTDLTEGIWSALDV